LVLLKNWESVEINAVAAIGPRKGIPPASPAERKWHLFAPQKLQQPRHGLQGRIRHAVCVDDNDAQQFDAGHIGEQHRCYVFVDSRIV
jgi:hypothetical protein